MPPKKKEPYAICSKVTFCHISTSLTETIMRHTLNATLFALLLSACDCKDSDGLCESDTPIFESDPYYDPFYGPSYHGSGWNTSTSHQPCRGMNCSTSTQQNRTQTRNGSGTMTQTRPRQQGFSGPSSSTNRVRSQSSGSRSSGPSRTMSSRSMGSSGRR